MTCNVLVLFANDSENLAKELISQFDNVSINAVCVDNLSQTHHLQQEPKSKIHVIFFSPDFLKFLENRPLDAYYLCGQLDTTSAIAVFCNGLREKNILCYHMAPLKSFNSWSKFEIEQNDSDSSVFPQELLNRLREEVTEDDIKDVKIVIIPQFLSRHDNSVYVIFSNFVKEPISVHLHETKGIPMCTENVNPYVLKFCVPGCLFQFSHNVTVSIEAEDRLLAKQVIHLSQENSMRQQTASGKRKSSNVHPSLSMEELYLNEQLKFLTNFSDINYDAERCHTVLQRPNHQLQNDDTKNETDADASLRELCKQYGLEELSLLMNDGPLPVINSSKRKTLVESKEQIPEGVVLRKDSAQNVDLRLPDMDESYRMDSFLGQDTDSPRLRYPSRSLSLPSTLLPTVDVLDSCGHYMDMGGCKHKDMKPHEKLLKGLRHSDGFQEDCEPELHSLLTSKSSSERYASLSLGESTNDLRARLKKDLSHSQQELLDLMHEFKDGEVTISNVERQFQLWTKRHCIKNDTKETDLRNRKTLNVEKTRKTPTFALPWKNLVPRKPKKKDTIRTMTVYNGDVRQSNSDQQAGDTSARKISNTSASSSSSKTSNASTISPRVGQKDQNKLLMDDAPMTFSGWISSYSPSSNKSYCPLYPERNPPPLPSRPPPPKPIPFPRKNPPLAIVSNENQIECQGYENVQQDNFQTEDKPPFLDYNNGGILVESANCVDVERGFCEAKLHEIPSPKQDSGGYECPIPTTSTIHKENPRIKVFKRPNSLPSNFSQSGEFPEDILTENTGELYNTNGESTFKKQSRDHSDSMIESLSSNVYMSLLQFSRKSCREGKQGLSKDLSASQQELLELMYAFKRGEKTISQVEQQFQDWHTRHYGSPAICPSRYSEEKNRKQTAFGLPGLKNFILGKPKKKSSAESKCSDYSPELKRTKKTSESSNSSHKRMSKISCTSVSSGNSEHSEVFRVNKEHANCHEINPISVYPPYPKRPLPLPPPVKLLPPTPDVLKEDDHHEPPISATEMHFEENDVVVEMKKPKPIPPPKPKFLTQQNSSVVTACESSSDVGIISEETKEDIKEFDPAQTGSRPSSPDYIIPNICNISRPGKKKYLASLPKTTGQISNKQDGATSSFVPVSPDSNTHDPLKRNMSTSDEATFLPHTMELLKMANLLSCPEEKASKFYIRRSRSCSDLKISHQPLYIELLSSVDGELNNDNLLSEHPQINHNV